MRQDEKRQNGQKGITQPKDWVKTRYYSISGSRNTGRASGPQCPILHSPSPIHAEREARRTNATHSDVDPEFRFFKMIWRMGFATADADAALMLIWLWCVGWPYLSCALCICKKVLCYKYPSAQAQYFYHKSKLIFGFSKSTSRGPPFSCEVFGFCGLCNSSQYLIFCTSWTHLLTSILCRGYSNGGYSYPVIPQYGSYNPYGTVDRRQYAGTLPRDGLYNYDPYRRCSSLSSNQPQWSSSSCWSFLSWWWW